MPTGPEGCSVLWFCGPSRGAYHHFHTLCSVVRKRLRWPPCLPLSFPEPVQPNQFRPAWGIEGLRTADFRHVDWIGCRLCRPCRNRLPLRLLVVKAAVSRNHDLKIRGYTVGQAPNLPLVVVIVAAVVGRITEQGSVTDRIADSVFFVSLSIWSYLETFDGVNAFRRVLGIAGFVVVLRLLVGELR